MENGRGNGTPLSKQGSTPENVKHSKCIEEPVRAQLVVEKGSWEEPLSKQKTGGDDEGR